MIASGKGLLLGRGVKGAGSVQQFTEAQGTSVCECSARSFSMDPGWVWWFGDDPSAFITHFISHLMPLLI